MTDTRDVFRLLEPWEKNVFYIVALITVIVFIVFTVRRLMRYDIRKLIREKGFWKRFFRAIYDASTNRTLLHGDIFAGVMHFCIFWGMIFLLIGTIILALNIDIIEIVAPSYSFWHGTFYVVYSFILDFFGSIAFIGIIGMMGRRVYLRKTQMSYRTRTLNDHGTERSYILDDWVFVGLLFVVIIGGFILEGLRLRDPKYSEWYSFAGTFTSWLLSAMGISTDMANAVYPHFWWFHGIISFIWIMYVPVSKGWHIFAGILSLSVSDELAGKRLSRPNLESEENFPTGTVKDLTGRSFVMIDACIRCGRCHAACPAQACEHPLSPRDLILNMKPLDPKKKEEKIVGPIIKEEMIWACTTCYACMNRCPLKIEHIPFIVEFRRYLVMVEGNIASDAQNLLKSLERYSNAYSMSNSSRGDWASELNVKVLDEGNETDVLYFAGCAASFDPRNQEVAKSFVRILQKAGIDVAILGPNEGCCGDPARRLGHEFVAQMLMQANVDMLNKLKFRRIVTTCPHCYNTLKNEYPQFGGRYEVYHHTEFLAKLIKEGKIKISASKKETVTYHDSCYLGRYNGVYDAPREILRALGCKIVEMPKNREIAFCCGGGGGKVFMEDKSPIRLSHRRIDEAVNTGASTLATACPFCMTMFEDATKSKDLREKILPHDIVEIIEKGMMEPEDSKPVS